GIFDEMETLRAVAARLDVADGSCPACQRGSLVEQRPVSEEKLEEHGQRLQPAHCK
ncbi:unnamed protein product, partial [Prorocentrum cordatum]